MGSPAKDADHWTWTFDTTGRDAPSWVVDLLWVWPRVGGINFQPDHPEGPRIIYRLNGCDVHMEPGDTIVKLSTILPGAYINFSVERAERELRQAKIRAMLNSTVEIPPKRFTSVQIHDTMGPTPPIPVDARDLPLPP